MPENEEQNRRARHRPGLDGVREGRKTTRSPEGYRAGRNGRPLETSSCARKGGVVVTMNPTGSGVPGEKDRACPLPVIGRGTDYQGGLEGDRFHGESPSFQFGPWWRQARAFSVGFGRVESFRERDRDRAEVEKAWLVV
ncbi:hypothetical protein THAOC_29305 [Thalassiosira oceanica]|uniref:Uncharacterized protein n=1 Tax=Thalassiosira oceanica TaxID=159749 RepID=K0RE72_THAOC|nr:hypothetical protein THAOC_29305 [Thalassiosira oceanica]|eukprot:EJK51520.1 hypothetical protein THAOC_29305 [Thalassiosira oceanica]